MNVHDSENMLGILSENGYAAVNSPEDADLIIFNTCAIRAKAEQKFFSQLGRTKQLKKTKKDLKIAVAGCIAQNSKHKIFKRAPFVDFSLGPQNIHLVNELVSGKHQKTLFEENPEMACTETPSLRQDKIKAWVSIMYGCNNFCSYCIVPYTRGREVSRPGSSILSEITALRDSGYKEVTLLGQNVNSYKSDTDFAGLLRGIDSLGIERTRFVTSHPRDLSDDLINSFLELPSLCEHMHLPIQSGSDRILGLMNRRYTYKEYLNKIRMLREKVPGIALTTDIISGFPGETEADHALTMNALKEIEFDGIYAFKFSARRGTKAYEMKDDLAEEIKTERLDSILKTQEEITLRKNKALEGSVQEILIEGYSESDKTMLTGRTRTNKIVNMPDSNEKEGSLVNVIIEKASRHSLLGKKHIQDFIAHENTERA